MRPSSLPRLFRLTLLHALLAAGMISALAAQQPVGYRVQRDTLYYRLVNPYRMYWMRGADTIGPRQHEVRIESHVWSGSADHLAVRVSTQQLDVSRWSKVSDYEITPRGRVIAIDGVAPKPGSRADLLVPLPNRPLRVGQRWSDTTATGPGTGAVGEERDEAIRDHEVTRVFDTLETRVAELRAHGTWHMRLSFWVDSTAGRAAWLDVKGPMEEHALVDVSNGRLLQRSWHMDLRGRGVPPSGAADTVPAGLLSEETMRLDQSPRSRFLMRPLPGTDTAITVDGEHGAPILLHTVGREASGLVASMVRNDGTVGMARVRFNADTMAEYHATWTADSGDGLVEQVVTREGARLSVHRTGARATVLAVPSGVWGVADYAMQALLAPVLLALPHDGTPRPLSVYRPFAGHWDTGTVAVQERAALLLVTVRVADQPPEVLVFTPEGDYLYGENSGPTGAKRYPLGASRQERLKEFFAALKAGG